MKTYKPGSYNPSLFACEPAGMDTKKDFWSPDCGWGCGQGRDSKLLNQSSRNPHCNLQFVSSIMEPPYAIMSLSKVGVMGSGIIADSN